jgi:hypothetical protein
MEDQPRSDETCDVTRDAFLERSEVRGWRNHGSTTTIGVNRSIPPRPLISQAFCRPGPDLPLDAFRWFPAQSVHSCPGFGTLRAPAGEVTYAAGWASLQSRLAPVKPRPLIHQPAIESAKPGTTLSPSPIQWVQYLEAAVRGRFCLSIRKARKRPLTRGDSYTLGPRDLETLHVVRGARCSRCLGVLATKAVGLGRRAERSSQRRSAARLRERR